MHIPALSVALGARFAGLKQRFWSRVHPFSDIGSPGQHVVKGNVERGRSAEEQGSYACPGRDMEVIGESGNAEEGAGSSIILDGEPDQVARSPQQGKVLYGCVWFAIDGDWQQVPRELWVWRPHHRTYGRCAQCNFKDHCVHTSLVSYRYYDGTLWIPELSCDPIRTWPCLIALKDGTVWSTIQGQWTQVHHDFWAWKLEREAFDGCRWCRSLDDCGHAYHNRYGQYRDTIWTSESTCTWDPSRLTPSPSSSSSSRALGPQIPPELFKLICISMDVGALARTCRLVCRYWDSLCRERAFAEINLGESEERMLDLVRRFKHDAAWQHIPQVATRIERIPECNRNSKAPWLHLLDPRWDRSKFLNIVGPFPGHQTLRSIHFPLPRSLPPSFSRRITWLDLRMVGFRQFEDTAHLVSELPDLERMFLFEVSWESLPTDAPRRRPRTDRNKLDRIYFNGCSSAGVKAPSFAFAAYTLFLNIYTPSSKSFFPADVLATIESTLKTVRSTPAMYLLIKISRDAEGRANRFDVCSDEKPIIVVRVQQPNSTDAISTSVFIDLNHNNTEFVSDDSDEWTLLDNTIDVLPQCPKFMFGLCSRENMTRFATNVVNRKLSSLVRRGEVKYAIEGTSNYTHRRRHWYQGALQSEYLREEEAWWEVCS